MGFGARGHGRAVASRQWRCLESESRHCHGSGWSICFGIRPQPAAGTTKNRDQLLGNKLARARTATAIHWAQQWGTKFSYPSLGQGRRNSGQTLLSVGQLAWESWELDHPILEGRRHGGLRLAQAHSRFMAVAMSTSSSSVFPTLNIFVQIGWLKDFRLDVHTHSY